MSIVIPAGNVTGFPGSVNHIAYARRERAAGELAWHHGITNGGIPSPGAGTRQVTVTQFTAYICGVLVEAPSDYTLTVAANGSGANRLDYVVLTVDWAALTVTLRVITGGAVLPALTQTVGSSWDLPIGTVTVRPNVTTIAGADIVRRAPVPRNSARWVVSNIPATTLNHNHAGLVVATVNVPDPGWPYIVEASTTLNANGGSGFARATINAGTSTIAVGRSDQLAPGTGNKQLNAAGTSEILTGAQAVTLTFAPVNVNNGDQVEIQASLAMQNAFHVLRHPA